MDGWIKLHRQLLESDTFCNEKKLKIFIYCLLKATHTEHEQVVGKQKVLLKPGQFIFGRMKASEALNMKQSTVWDYMLSLMNDDKSINIESNNKYSVVTVVNWGLYQLEDEKPDNKITTNRQQNNTNKNGKNLNLLSYINKDPLEDKNSEAYKKLKSISKSIFG